MIILCLLSDLLKLEPLQLRDFIRRSETRALSNVNYCLGIAEGATGKTFAKEPPDLTWAEVALDVYGKLANRNPKDSHSFEISAMMIRVRLILEYGPQPDTVVGGSADIVHWFLEKLILSLEEVRAKLPIALQESNLDEIRQLRQIKDRLAVLKVLDQHDLLPNQPELREWLNLAEQLP